jgi:hypothetical protein
MLAVHEAQPTSMSVGLRAMLAVWSLRLGTIVPKLLAFAQISCGQFTELARDRWAPWRDESPEASLLHKRALSGA